MKRPDFDPDLETLSLRFAPFEFTLDLAPAAERTIILEVEGDWPYEAFLPNLAWFLRAENKKDLSGLEIEADNVLWMPQTPSRKGFLAYEAPEGRKHEYDFEERVLLYSDLSGLKSEVIRHEFYKHVNHALKQSGELYLSVNGESARVRSAPEVTEQTFRSLF